MYTSDKNTSERERERKKCF